MRKRTGNTIYLRRRRTGFRLRRVLLVSIVVFLCAFAAYHVVGKVARPYLVGWQESREIAQLKKESAAIEAENRELKQRIAYIRTPAGVEAEARKQGMVREGEVALLVQTPEQASSEQAEAHKLANPTMWQKVVSRVADFFVSDRKPVPKG